MIEACLYLAVVVVVGIVFWPIVTQPSEALYSPYSDILSQHLPFRHLLSASVREHQRLPLWNPTSFGGMPLVGDPQAGLFYPPNWLHALLPPEHGASLFGPIMMLHLVIGGWGMLFWLKGHQIPRFARLAGALAFVFCGKWFYHVVVPGHVIFLPFVWVPWQCGLIDHVCCRPSGWPTRRWSALLAIATGMVLLGAHPQILFYSQLIVATYSLLALSRLWGSWEELRRSFGHLVLAAALGLLLGAVQIIPALDLVVSNAAVRSGGLPYDYAARRSAHFEDAQNLVLPSKTRKTWEESVYLGVVALSLAPFGILWPRRRRNSIFFLCWLLFGFWYALGSNGGLHHFLYAYAPGFKLFRIPTRMVLVLGIPLGYLAATGFAALTADSSYRWTKRILAWLLLGLGVWVYNLAPTKESTIALALLALPTCITLPWPSRARLVIECILLAAMVSDVTRYTLPMVDSRPLEEILGENPVVNRLEVPLGEQRVLPMNSEQKGRFTSLPITYSSPAGIESIVGFNPLIPRGTFDFVNRGLYRNDERWSYGTGLGMVELNDRRFLDLFNVRYIVSNQPLDIPGLTLRDEWDDLEIYHFSFRTKGKSLMPKTYLYENTEALPRAYLVREAMVAEDPIEALRTIDPRQTVVVDEGTETDSFAGDFQEVPLEHHRDEILLDVDAGTGGYLVINEIWYPGWQAYDSGEVIPIERGNGIFQMLRLGPGEHKIRLRYRPTSYLLGRWLTLVALLVTLSLLLWPVRGDVTIEEPSQSGRWNRLKDKQP
ncbi:YfhO family protein [Planctomycetes bacterium Pan216]